MKHIFKVGLVTTDKDNRILVVLKKGGKTYILPGGKPTDSDEIDINCLARELKEELGVVMVGDVHYLGSFGSLAADLVDTTVTVRAYESRIVGDPVPQAEIDALHWLDIYNPDVPIAETIEKGILPILRTRFRKA